MVLPKTAMSHAKNEWQATELGYSFVSRENAFVGKRRMAPDDYRRAGKLVGFKTAQRSSCAILLRISIQSAEKLLYRLAKLGFRDNRHVIVSSLR